jgi:hypothetical protein
MTVDAYFLRLTDNHNAFVHYNGDDGSNLIYEVKESCVGAAIWHEQEGLAFIKESGAKNIELVNVNDVLK